jgi:hypothetical protein
VCEHHLPGEMCLISYGDTVGKILILITLAKQSPTEIMSFPNVSIFQFLHSLYHVRPEVQTILECTPYDLDYAAR